MRIYISGSIAGNKSHKEQFERIEKKLLADGHDVINPAGLNHVMNGSFTWKEYMNVCIELLNLSEAVVMLDGWEKSAGACVEYGYSLATDKTIIRSEDYDRTCKN